ncbi:carotenoid oxygenase [Richelia sinica FACHB-800]|uniref:Carotenoid oxygenase n=1 Tax=Richelia sinica FACHB-800 TaxID=1357546 RepID=A0A975Y4J8_9NOST|nr:carotenoid oxygenase family protein [Richelia sinica]MBD2664656.1 carotenoid oxygenase family protein [Richelia sinica FACHB-800]QXE23249.1 carotenoid oxygenase [Richelia sinica FACHB-800]
MQTTNKQSTKPAWAGAISQPAKEFPLTPLPIITGKIPDGLRGTLYRNGAARLQRGGMSVGHWFDGDGAILAIHFTDAGATGIYRYVQTTGYQAENAAGKLLYGNYGMTAPGPIWNQWRRPVKHSANTSVLALPDKLLALWEGNHPYALDLQTLETQGLDDLSGLTPGQPYSAHPKVDDATGEIFNFGMTPGPNAILNVFKSDRSGKVLKTAKFTLSGFSIIHDFVLAGPYLIFFAPAVRLNIWPVLFGFNTYSDSFSWQPELGNQILVIDRENLSLVSRGVTEPWFQWHFSNGYVDDSGTVVIDFAKYADFQTNQYLKEISTGSTHTVAQTTFTRVQLNPQTGKVTNIETLLDRTCEFPNVPPQNVGKFSRYSYMSIFRQGTDIAGEILNSIARLDLATGTLTEANCGENCYPSEPLPIQDKYNSQQSWVLTVVYDGNSQVSEVWIFDHDAINEEPICKLALPSVIPHSFHGTWKAQI